MLFLSRLSRCKLLFSFSPSPKAWLGATASGWTPLFLRPRRRNRSGGNLQVGLVKPTSSRWESPGGRELSLLNLLITILLCVKGVECETFRHQEKTQWFVQISGYFGANMDQTIFRVTKPSSANVSSCERIQIVSITFN